MKKKGQNLGGLSMLVPAVILIAVAGIVAALALEMTGDIQDDMTAASAEYNATGDAITGLAEIPSKLPTIGLAVAIVVVLGIIVGLFAMFRGRR